MQPVRVVIADDHPVVRSGIRDMLEGYEDIDIVGEAASGEEALRLVESKQPNVLLLDVEMPELSGVEVAQRLDEQDSPVRLLALSSYDNQEYVQGLFEGGASGYLTKENAPQLIVEAVRAVARGEVRWFVRPERDADKSAGLTDREADVLRLMAEGKSNTDIGEELYISESTVRKHATSLYRKLDVDSGREAIAWAWQNGIISDSELE
jgi:DNA-binding NarL/FixJ family response regulator